MLFRTRRIVLSGYSALFLLVMLFSSAHAQGLKFTPVAVKIFDTPVMVNTYENTTKPKNLITFVSLHHNEQLGLRLVKEEITAKGGKLVEVVSRSILKNEPQRYVHFIYKEFELCVDPNRIFSRTGILASLRKIGKGDENCQNNLNAASKLVIEEPEVLNAVDGFQAKLLALFLPKKKDEVLVAVHNNKRNGSISARSFLKEGDPEYDNNEALYAVHNESVNDFFMVSTNALFDKLFSNKPGNNRFNIAIQKQHPDEDEGFLSARCANMPVPVNYIIIEAMHRLNNDGDDHAFRQRQMIDRLIELFPAPYE